MRFVFVYLLLLTGFLPGAVAQDMDKKARDLADTSQFSPNNKGGWMVYSSYLKQVSKDSVVMEVVLRHDKTIDWKQYQLIGKIKNKKLAPGQVQEIPFLLVNDGYKLKIEKDGRCYVSLVSGELPPQDPVILPFRITFKRS